MILSGQAILSRLKNAEIFKKRIVGSIPNQRSLLRTQNRG